MGDDFFEDQPVEAPSEKKTPKKESDTVKQSQANKNAKKSGKVQAKAPVAAKPAAAGGVPQQVDLIWTVALVVVAFVLGFFFRGLFAPAATTTPGVSNNLTSMPSVQGGQTAPPLEEGQLEQGLPQGHPSIGGESTQSGGTSAAPNGFMPSGTEGSMGDVKSDVPASGPLTGEGQSIEVPADKKNGKE